MQMQASSLTLDFLSFFCAFTASGMKAGLLQHPWVPIPARVVVVGSGDLLARGRSLHPASFSDSSASRFFNAEAGRDFCLNKCPSFTFACGALSPSPPSSSFPARWDQPVPKSRPKSHCLRSLFAFISEEEGGGEIMGSFAPKEHKAWMKCLLKAIVLFSL